MAGTPDPGNRVSNLSGEHPPVPIINDNWCIYCHLVRMLMFSEDEPKVSRRSHCGVEHVVDSCFAFSHIYQVFVQRRKSDDKYREQSDEDRLTLQAASRDGIVVLPDVTELIKHLDLKECPCHCF